jgi:hypothetical protein
MSEILDERSHEPSEDSAWRESFYFAFMDQEAGLGAYMSLGEKPLSGRGGYICTIWHEELIAETRIDAMRRTELEHACGGMDYRLEAPTGRWAVRYEATVPVLGPRGREYVGSLSPEGSLRRVEVAMDLRFEPLTPAYAYRKSPVWARLFDGHVEQSGRFVGEARVDGRTYEIDSLGSRDHSWGPRDWAHPLGWTFASMSFAQGPAFVSLWAADTVAGSAADGYIGQAGDLAQVVALDTDLAGGRPELGVPFTVALSDSHGEVTKLSCTAHTAVSHQVGGGTSTRPARVMRWLVEIDSDAYGHGHGEFELLLALES